MRKLMSRRPSPGLVVGCLALAVALGGTAAALPGSNNVDGNDLKKNVVRSKHIKNKQVKPGDLNAKARSPRAYAFVTADNEVDESKSRGITDEMVNLDADDFYCFYDLGFNPKHVQATVEWTDVNADVIGQASLVATNTCDGNEVASFRAFDVSGGIFVPSADFYIAFFE